jgi:hypothetical protein
MSAEVRAILFRSLSFLLSFVTEWISGDRTQKILWNTTFDSSAIFHNVTLQTLAIYTEILDQAEWGTLYFATPNSVSFMYIYLLFFPHGLCCRDPMSFPKAGRMLTVGVISHAAGF